MSLTALNHCPVQTRDADPWLRWNSHKTEDMKRKMGRHERENKILSADLMSSSRPSVIIIRCNHGCLSADTQIRTTDSAHDHI